MSFDTNLTWVYQVVGKNIHLYQYVQTANTDTLAGYRIRLPNDYYGNQLIYPDEAITNGLMYEGTAFIEPFTTPDPNELNGNDNPTIDNVTSPTEATHVNLSRMLSLAVVDYIKAMVADGGGEIEKKEYYMREFWKKIGDDQSNKRRISISFPVGAFAVR